MDNKLTGLKKCDKCMGIGIFECEHNTSERNNMPDIKQRAHKLFDELCNSLSVSEFLDSEFDRKAKDFIDEIIDIAVAERDKEIVERWNNYVDETVADEQFNRHWLKAHMKNFISKPKLSA